MDSGDPGTVFIIDTPLYTQRRKGMEAECFRKTDDKRGKPAA
jgi:hypothetical protein